MEPELSVPPGQKPTAYKSAAPHPYACFRCRRSFKRASRSQAVLPCPNCGGPAIGLTRKFKPPKADDCRQWQKVEALVRHGFLFWSLPEPYPDTLNEVPAFAARNAKLVAEERARNPAAFAEIDAALSER